MKWTRIMPSCSSRKRRHLRTDVAYPLCISTVLNMRGRSPFALLSRSIWPETGTKATRCFVFRGERTMRTSLTGCQRTLPLSPAPFPKEHCDSRDSSNGKNTNYARDSELLMTALLEEPPNFRFPRKQSRIVFEQGNTCAKQTALMVYSSR